MTEKKPKKKVEIQTRTPEKRGIFDNIGKGRQQNVKHPFGELMETLPYPTVPNPTVVQATTPDPTLPEDTISPHKNFTKVSNSILKEAIPEGLFRGQSKHTYDVLYLNTRGAINPVRQIQLTKTELVKLTGLEIKTIQRHLSFLRSTGLIIVDPKIGDHKGAVYEVKIPEEMTLPYPTLPQASVVEGTLVETGVNYTPLPGINYTTVGLGNPHDNKGDSDSPKTLLKTNTKNDDEEKSASVAVLVEKLDQASIKLTGKGLSRKDSEKWGILAELLILELEVAASRAEGVSSVPAFLTEVLRRQFFSSRQQSAVKPAKLSVDKLGKSEAGIYEIKPLDKQGREAALRQLHEFAGDDFLQDFEKWYTAEDWTWLIKNLEER